MNDLKVITEMRQSYPSFSLINDRRICYHFFFGDESTLELYTALKKEVDWYNHKYIGVLELPEDMLNIPEKQGLLVDVVPQSHKPAAQAIAYLSRLEQELWALWKHGIFYLSGKDASVNEFEKALYQRDILPAQILHIGPLLGQPAYL